MDEKEKVLYKHFSEGTQGPLQTFPKKEKHRQFILEEIANRFEPNRVYDEKEINAVLSVVYDDYVMIRRYLVDFGFLNRTPSGNEYWVKQTDKEEGVEGMDRKKELKQQYKETKSQAGVYQVRNILNEKSLYR